MWSLAKRLMMSSRLEGLFIKAETLWWAPPQITGRDAAAAAERGQRAMSVRHARPVCTHPPSDDWFISEASSHVCTQSYIESTWSRRRAQSSHGSFLQNTGRKHRCPLSKLHFLLSINDNGEGGVGGDVARRVAAILKARRALPQASACACCIRVTITRMREIQSR